MNQRNIRLLRVDYLLTNRIEFRRCLEKPVGHLFRLFHKSTAFVANIYHVRFRYL